MHRLVFMAISISLSAIGMADYFSKNGNQISASRIVQGDEISLAKPENVTAKNNTKPVQLSGVERITRAKNGHYQAMFKLNNSRVQGLIDTGASAIAINQKTAKQAGIRLSAKDFIYEVRTANGITKAARATIDRVEFGSIRIRNVEALVMEDKSLDTVLIGMSFMNRLRSFEYQSDKLVLRN